MFKCSQCVSTFISKDDLEGHESTHEMIYSPCNTSDSTLSNEDHINSDIIMQHDHGMYTYYNFADNTRII